MVERPKRSERPTISETLRAVHAVGDMILVGLKECRERLKAYPFTPDVDEFSCKIWQTTGFGELKPEQKEKIAQEFGRIWLLMEERADYQRRYSADPTGIKHNIFENIVRDIGPEFHIDLKDIRIEWGLFSMVVVAKEKSFKVLLRALEPITRDEALLGIVTPRFVGPLGEVPIVLDKERTVRTSIWHEDIHALQAARGDLVSFFDLKEELERPELLRAVYNEDIQSDDLEVCLDFLERVCKEAKQEVDIELRAYLWDHELPGASLLLDSPEIARPIELALIMVHNAAYAPVSCLTEKQRVATNFSAVLQVMKVYHYWQLLNACIHRAVKNYQGEVNPWDWVASRVTALPVRSSFSLAQAVLLGKGGKLEKPPKLGTIKPLAQALMIHARRGIILESYGQGEEIPKKRVEDFWLLLERIFNERILYSDICQSFGMGEEDLLTLRKEVINYATKSVPKGTRGKTRKRLSKILQ